MATFAIPSTIFREYDIRGVSETDLSSDLFRALGRAFAELVGAPKTVALGRDCRLSSDRLYDALLDGLLAGGLDVVDVGIGPTPMLYFAVHHLKVDGGLMITGSHNPPHENGVKMLRRSGSIYGVEIQDLRKRIEAGKYGEPERGSVSKKDVNDDYAATMKSNIKLARTDLKFVVDAGNGSAGPLAMKSMKALGL